MRIELQHLFFTVAHSHMIKVNGVMKDILQWEFPDMLPPLTGLCVLHQGQEELLQAIPWLVG